MESLKERLDQTQTQLVKMHETNIDLKTRLHKEASQVRSPSPLFNPASHSLFHPPFFTARPWCQWNSFCYPRQPLFCPKAPRWWLKLTVNVLLCACNKVTLLLRICWNSPGFCHTLRSTLASLSWLPSLLCVIIFCSHHLCVYECLIHKQMFVRGFSYVGCKWNCHDSVESFIFFFFLIIICFHV